MARFYPKPNAKKTWVYFLMKILSLINISISLLTKPKTSASPDTHVILQESTGDKINAYKIIDSGFDSSITSMFPRSNSDLRGHGKKVFIEPCNKDIRKFNLTMRVRKIWIELPENVVILRDVKPF